jgi:hypothetical protein
LNESVLSVMESLVPDYLGNEWADGWRARAQQRLPVRGRHHHHRRRQRGRDLPALHADHRQTRPPRRPRPADPTSADGGGAKNSTQRSGNGPYAREDALKLLDDAGVPSGPIYTAADICADERYATRNMIQDFAVDTGESQPRTVGFPGIVPVIGDASLPIRRVGRDLGEHTRDVLSSLLGLTDDEIGALT